jgi:hypothetical protein
MFRVVLPPIIRSAYNCSYSICYLSHRYCYLPLSWKSWNRFECAVGGSFLHPALNEGSGQIRALAALALGPISSALAAIKHRQFLAIADSGTTNPRTSSPVAWSLYRRRYSEIVHMLFYLHHYDGYILWWQLVRTSRWFLCRGRVRNPQGCLL